MTILRTIGIGLLIFVMGYLSFFGLFADGNIVSSIVLLIIFLAGSAGVGALIPNRWQLAALCSWGAIVMVVLEIGSTITRGSVPGQQPAIQVIMIGLIAVALALLGGYFGHRLRQN